MAYCRKCGEAIDDEAVVCPKCGVAQNNKLAATNTRSSYDSGSKGWQILGLFFPIIGLILYLVWINTKPLSAKSAGIGALTAVGICLGTLLGYAIMKAICS